MVKQYVSELRDGETVDSPFVARDKSLVPFRNKAGEYLALKLADRTGEVRARLWDGGKEAFRSFQEGDFLRVRGRVESYQGSLQIIIASLARLEPEAVEAADFLPHTAQDLHALWERLEEAIGSVREPSLRALLADLFENDGDLAARFARAPAALKLHHAYIGGLLEHTVEVAELCDGVCRLFDALDRDLLITGALLHDIGKTAEFSYTHAIGHTDEGMLLGHIALGERMVAERIAGIPGFADTLALRLRHLLLTHHGDPEWGAVTRPKIPEAIALHHAENLDAKVNGYLQAIEKHPDPEAAWTDYVSAYSTRIFRGPARSEE